MYVCYYSFCSIVIDGILIAATTGASLFDTINATSKKAIEKIKNYSRQQMVRSTIIEIVLTKYCYGDNHSRKTVQ